jgi:hypothetical protein
MCRGGVLHLPQPLIERATQRKSLIFSVFIIQSSFVLSSARSGDCKESVPALRSNHLRVPSVGYQTSSYEFSVQTMVRPL